MTAQKSPNPGMSRGNPPGNGVHSPDRRPQDISRRIPPGDIPPYPAPIAAPQDLSRRTYPSVPSSTACQDTSQSRKARTSGRASALSRTIM